MSISEVAFVRFDEVLEDKQIGIVDALLQYVESFNSPFFFPEKIYYMFSDSVKRRTARNGRQPKPNGRISMGVFHHGLESSLDVLDIDVAYRIRLFSQPKHGARGQRTR